MGSFSAAFEEAQGNKARGTSSARAPAVASTQNATKTHSATPAPTTATPNTAVTGSAFKDKITQEYTSHGGTAKWGGWSSPFSYTADLDDPNDSVDATQEQIKNATIMGNAVNAAIPTLQKNILDASEGNRFSVLKSETSFIPNADKMLNATNKFGLNFQASFASAIGENPEFASTLAERLQSGDSGMIEGLNSIEPKYAPQLTQIMDTIANAGQNGTAYDFDNLDNLLKTAKEYAELARTRQNKLDHNKNADVSEDDDALSAKQDILFKQAKVAGANIPAFGNIDGAVMMGFIGNLFDPNMSAKDALNSLGSALKMDPEQLAALQRTLGPIMGIMKTVMQPYADLFNKYKGPAKEWGNELVKDVKTLSGTEQSKIYSSSTVDKAAVVTPRDDITFTKGVEGDLTGSSPIGMQDVFNAMRNNAPDDAQREINDLEKAANVKGSDLSKTFKTIASKPAEEIAKAVNDAYNKMETGATPREAFTMQP